MSRLSHLFRKYIKKEKHDMILEIKRVSSDDEGTLGVLYTEGFASYTLELPWRDNLPFVSCIPAGTYTAALDEVSKIGGEYVIRFNEVSGRTGILIHVGNTAGDVYKSYESGVSGCIAVGYSQAKLHNQKAVLSSRKAMNELISLTRGKQSIGITIENLFKLEVQDV